MTREESILILQKLYEGYNKHKNTDLIKEAYNMAIEALNNSKTEERTKKRTETHACDCISRQDAIDEIARWIGYLDDDMVGRIQFGLKHLPSAQPEIIHCGDCKKCQIDSVFHDYWCDGRKVWKDHYCGYAERRTDERSD